MTVHCTRYSVDTGKVDFAQLQHTFEGLSEKVKVLRIKSCWSAILSEKVKVLRIKSFWSAILLKARFAFARF